jgi:hypothetical protein
MDMHDLIIKEKIKNWNYMVLPNYTHGVIQNWVYVPLPAPTIAQDPPLKPAQPAHNDTRTDVQHEQCSICMENKRCVLFSSCGHIVSCWSCSADLHECPLCRKAIADKLKAFI